MEEEGGAEAVLNMQPGSSITVAYHPLFGAHDELILLELDNNLLPDVMNGRVTIRGESEEEAVLCTPTNTFSIKFACSSNTLFLIPPRDYLPSPELRRRKSDLRRCSVVKQAAGSLQVAEIPPDLDKLRRLLTAEPYTSGDISPIGTTWDDLSSRVQASDEQLRAALMAFAAVEISGEWRTVAEEYMESVLDAIVLNSIISGWSLQALDEEKVVISLVSDGFSGDVAAHCLRLCGRRTAADDGGEGRVWRMDEREICVRYAKGILRSGEKKMEKFMEEWKNKIPEGMNARLEMLQGEVLTEKIGAELWVRPFSAAALPVAAALRFRALFEERPRWEWKDLQHYLRDLKVPGISSEELLLKYTRRSQSRPHSEPVFSRR